MKERAGDMAAPSARCPERTSLAVGEIGQRLVVAGRDQRRVVEFVAAHRSCPPRPIGLSETQPRLAIAEVQLALREAGRMAEQPGHGVADAVGVLEAFAQHHVAAALAVDRAGLRQTARARRGNALRAASAPACSSG